MGAAWLPECLSVLLFFLSKIQFPSDIYQSESKGGGRGTWEADFGSIYSKTKPNEPWKNVLFCTSELGLPSVNKMKAFVFLQGRRGSFLPPITGLKGPSFPPQQHKYKQTHKNSRISLMSTWRNWRLTPLGERTPSRG